MTRMMVSSSGRLNLKAIKAGTTELVYTTAQGVVKQVRITITDVVKPDDGQGNQDGDGQGQDGGVVIPDNNDGGQQGTNTVQMKNAEYCCSDIR